MRQEFSKSLQTFLIGQGYTHIYCMGIRAEPAELEDSENYFLIPLKPNDPRMLYQEAEMHIEEINSPEVNEMANGDEFISFFVDMLSEDGELFYSKK